MANNMQDLLRQVQKAQKNMEKVQEELGGRNVEGTSGGGMVTVTATGRQEITAIRINKECVDPGDVAMLEDLVLTAVQDALAKSHELADGEMGKLTGGLKIPGL